MMKWLAIGAAASLIWAGEARAQRRDLEAAQVAGMARLPTPELHATHNLRLSEPAPIASGHPLVAGMLVSRDVAPNAMVGLGLVNMSARRKSGVSVGISSRSGHRKPAVTFVLKF